MVPKGTIGEAWNHRGLGVAVVRPNQKIVSIDKFCNWDICVKDLVDEIKTRPKAVTWWECCSFSQKKKTLICCSIFDLVVWLLMIQIFDLWEAHEQLEFLVLSDGKRIQELKSNCSHFTYWVVWPNYIAKGGDMSCEWKQIFCWWKQNAQINYLSCCTLCLLCINSATLSAECLHRMLLFWIAYCQGILLNLLPSS